MFTKRSVKQSALLMSVLAGFALVLFEPQFERVALAQKANQAGGVPDLQQQFTALQAQVTALSDQVTMLTTQLNTESVKLADVSADPLTGDLFVTGVNLHVRSGSGATEGAVNGAGNLIIGYNESATGTGSHNLVVGSEHSYLSYGGIVVGQRNSIEYPFASVTGGNFNNARAPYSSVNGGFGNTASGDSSVVSGGYVNAAAGDYSTVSGGSSRHCLGVHDWTAGSLFEEE